MAARKETGDLLTCIKAAGGEVRRSRSGHWKIYLGNRLVTTIASSSSDVRSIRNARSILRRAGLTV